MSKEIYISTTPHETRLAIVEDEQLAEIYFERENEYTLAGSIYNGKVTRVLPGMQSSFVDIGLERDAFLYVTDFMEEQGDAADFDSSDGAVRRQPAAPREASEARTEPQRERPERGRGRRNEAGERRPAERPSGPPVTVTESTVSFDEPIAPAPVEAISPAADEEGLPGSRRWRGRRGRRRGRGVRDEQAGTAPVGGAALETGEAESTETDADSGVMERLLAEDGTQSDVSVATEEPETFSEPESTESQQIQTGRGRARGRDRQSRAAAPTFDNSYAGYGDSAPEQLDSGAGPVVLPGEVIRKYRDPAEVANETTDAAETSASKPAVIMVSKPGIEVVGWDGGSVLPGETLGRHRRGATSNDRETPRKRGRENESGRARTARQPEEIASGEEPEVPKVAAVEEADVPQAPAPLEQASSTDTLEGQDASAALRAEDVPAVEADSDFEPGEGASANLNAGGRQDLRRLEQSGGQQAENGGTELAGESPDPTTYDLHASEETTTSAAAEVSGLESVDEPAESQFTSLQSSGEMLSMASETDVERYDAPAAHPQDQPNPAGALAFEPAVHDSSVPAEALPAPSVSDSFETDEDADDDVIGVHAYGEGDFHEEELDEELDGEDFEYHAAFSTLDEGEEEYEEETLDDTAERNSQPDEPGPAVLPDEVVRAQPVSYAGGFTEADFGGEPSEDEDSEEAPSAASPQRDAARRPGAGSSRERRGGRGGNERGRGGRRQSVQTMDLPAINELLKPGQEILVQIAKEPIAKKGARITSHIALPGRFLVFMPTVNHTGVSRKISSDEERRRLKSLLLAEKGEAQGGFIVRTAAAGATDEELRNDLRFLIQMWTDIKARSEGSKSPALIYHDLNLVERILRDQVTDNFSAIWVDTEQEYERVLRFLQRFQPSLVRRVKLYTKETPLFEHFGVTTEIEKALKSKVWLKSGGSIVINQTEALVAIDINTGKYVGKTARLEDTILKTNLDAIPEIVRQIRLRDLGGIIVIDFIDMDERKNRAKVMQVLEDAMRVDRAPSKILPFNDFGLVIMTRKRVKQSLERTLCIPDPVTDGTGMIKSPVTIANEIYVEMRKMHRHLEKTDVMLRVHPEVVKTLKANGGKRLQELEDMMHKTILVKSDPALSPEAFDIH